MATKKQQKDKAAGGVSRAKSSIDSSGNRVMKTSTSSNSGGGSSAVGQPPATAQKYQYVRNDGSIGSASGMNEDEAFASIKDRAPTSGLIRLGAAEGGSGITASSGTQRQEEKKMGSEMTRLSAPEYSTPAKNLKYLDDFQKELTRMAGEEANSINERFDTQREDTEKKQKSEVGSTSASIARMGGYLGDSGSGTGVMLSLEQDHRAEILELESKRSQALLEARKLYAQKRFDVAKEKVQEAQEYEQEMYDRQQDFFQNQRSLRADERTETNQERDDARSVLTNIISNANGQSFDELDEETRDTIEESAQRAGYPLGVIKSMLEKPKALATKLDSLIKDAAKKGAPASILAAISEAGSFSEAAGIAAPYLAAKSGSGSGSGIDAKFVPSALRGVVDTQGASATLEQLLLPTPPGWFGGVANEVARANFKDLGLAEAPPDGVDPNGAIAASIWDTFRSRPDVKLFQAELVKKITGSADTSDFGYSAAPAAPSDLSE